MTSRFESHRSQLGNRVITSADSLEIRCYRTAGGMLVDFKIGGTVATGSIEETAKAMGLLSSLLAEFHNVALEASDDDECDCGEFN